MPVPPPRCSTIIHARRGVRVNTWAGGECSPSDWLAFPRTGSIWFKWIVEPRETRERERERSTHAEIYRFGFSIQHIDALEVTFTDSGSLGLTFAESPTGFAVLKTRPEGQARGKKLKVGYVLVAVGGRETRAGGYDQTIGWLTSSRQRPLRLSFLHPRSDWEKGTYYGEHTRAKGIGVSPADRPKGHERRCRRPETGKGERFAASSRQGQLPRASKGHVRYPRTRVGRAQTGKTVPATAPSRIPQTLEHGRGSGQQGRGGESSKSQRTGRG